MGWAEAEAARRQRPRPTTTDRFITLSRSCAVTLSGRRLRAETVMAYVARATNADGPCRRRASLYAPSELENLVKHRRKVCAYAQGDQYHLPCRPLSKLRHQENGRDNKREQQQPNQSPVAPISPDRGHRYRENETHQDARHPCTTVGV